MISSQSHFGCLSDFLLVQQSQYCYKKNKIISCPRLVGMAIKQSTCTDVKENFERARKLLLEAVDSLLEIANNGRENVAEEGTSLSLLKSGIQQTSQQSVPLPNSARSCNIESPRSQFQQDSVREYRSLFGFQPSKSYIKKRKGREKVLQKLQPTKPKWRRDSICLCETDQTSPEEKMKLAKMELGLKEIVFDSDGGVVVQIMFTRSYFIERLCSPLFREWI